MITVLSMAPPPWTREPVPAQHPAALPTRSGRPCTFGTLAPTWTAGSGGGRRPTLDPVTFGPARTSSEAHNVVDDAGMASEIFGRNVWQREHDESLRFVAQLRELLEKYPS